MKRDFIRFIIAAVICFLIPYRDPEVWLVIKLIGGFCFWFAIYYGGKLIARPLGII